MNSNTGPDLGGCSAGGLKKKKTPIIGQPIYKAI